MQPKKTFINRKIKTLQPEVSMLNKDGNIYNNLINIPEIPDLQIIKKYFNKTVTTGQCRAALDRLGISHCEKENGPNYQRPGYQ